MLSLEGYKAWKLRSGAPFWKAGWALARSPVSPRLTFPHGCGDILLSKPGSSSWLITCITGQSRMALLTAHCVIASILRFQGPSSGNWRLGVEIWMEGFIWVSHSLTSSKYHWLWPNFRPSILQSYGPFHSTRDCNSYSLHIWIVYCNKMERANSCEQNGFTWRKLLQ